jgi:hypothetical protein
MRPSSIRSTDTASDGCARASYRLGRAFLAPCGPLTGRFGAFGHYASQAARKTAWANGADRERPRSRRQLSRPGRRAGGARSARSTRPRSLSSLPEWFPEAGGYPWSLGNAAKMASSGRSQGDESFGCPRDSIGTKKSPRRAPDANFRGCCEMSRPRQTCGFEGCGRPHHGRGFCSLHYQRWRHYGDPNVAGRPRATIIGRARAFFEAALFERRRSLSRAGQEVGLELPHQHEEDRRGTQPRQPRLGRARQYIFLARPDARCRRRDPHAALLPFADHKVLELFAKFESGVYAGVGQTLVEA